MRGPLEEIVDPGDLDDAPGVHHGDSVAHVGDDAEIVRRTVEHMRSAHGETVIRENMIENIKARIRDEANAA